MKIDLDKHFFDIGDELIIDDYQLTPYNIKFKKQWKTAHSTHLYRHGFLLKLIINPSLSAIGECAPLKEIGTESLEQAQVFLEKKLPSLKGKKISAELLSDMDLYPACRFSLETAFLAIIAKSKKQSIAQLLTSDKTSDSPKSIKVNTMLGSINKDLPDKVKLAESQGFQCIKIKMGLELIKNEAVQLISIFKQISSTTLIRLDANKSWTIEETQWLLKLLEPYTNQIDCIEEPLKDYDQSQYQHLQNSTKIALALDESYTKHLSNNDISFEQYPVKKLILKPMAQGGLINTLQLAKQAQQAHIKVVITSSIETSYGLWPIAYLCSAINNNQFHGLDTASWLEETFIASPEIKHGTITL